MPLTIISHLKIAHLLSNFWGVLHSYSWQYPSGWTVQTQAGNQITLYVPAFNPQYGTVRVSVTNACGSSSFTGVTVFPGYSCTGFQAAGDFVIYPNPAEDLLSVELTENDSISSEQTLNELQFLEASENSFKVLIYNKHQKLLKEESVQGTKLALDVSALPPDVYILHILHKGKTIQEQIVIQ